MNEIGFERYGAYKDSGIKWLGEVPEHWEVKRLKDLGFLYSGLSGKKGDDFLTTENYFCANYIPFVNIANNQCISIDNLKKVRMEPKEKQNKVKENDIFFLMSSENYEDVGKSAILKTSLKNTYLNSFCRGFRIICKGINPNFINYLLMSNVYRNNLSIEGKGFTRINLKIEKINNLLMVLPQNKEQEAIANYLDTKTAQIDRKIDLLGKKAEKYGELKQSLINETVTRGLDNTVPMKDSGIEWIGEIPENWDVKRVKEISQINQRTLNDETSKAVEFEYIDIGSVTYGNNNISTEHTIFESAPSRARRIVLNGDIIVSTVRTYLKAIAYIDDRYSKCIASTGFAVITPNRGVHNKYFSYLLTSNLIIDKICAYSKGVSYPATNASTIGDLNSLAPPLIEQKVIADYLDTKTAQIDSIVENINSQIEKLKELRKMLINDVVTGKIKVVKDIAGEEVCHERAASAG